MATHSFTIPLTGGNEKVTDYYSGDKDDSTYVTVTDSGNLGSILFSGWGHGTATEAGEGSGGDDTLSIDLSGFNDDFDISLKSVDAGDTVFVSKALNWSNVGDVYTIEYLGSDNAVHTLVVDLVSTNSTGTASIVITCFAAGTGIRTPLGEVAVEALVPGDLVVCGDNVARPVRLIAQRYVAPEELATHPQFRPIRIRAGSLGRNLPESDLRVSPQHRILIDDWRAELMFGAPEVLVAAQHLVNDTDIMPDHRAEDVSYYHILFDSHQTVWSNGLRSESFFPGEQAFGSLVDATRREMLALFPELSLDLSLYGETCLPTLKAHEAKAMLGG